MTSDTSLPLFVVPIRNVPTLCGVREGSLVEVAALPVPPGAKYAVSAGGWIAWFHEDSGTIERAHLDAEPHEQSFAPLCLPEGAEVCHVAFHGDILYFAAEGRRAEHLFGRFDCRDPAPRWAPVAWPDGKGCSLGSLFLDGDRLIALDSHSCTVSFLVYDLTDPQGPRFAGRRQVMPRSNSEGAETGAAGNSWVGLLGVGWGFGEELHFVSLLDRASLEEQGRVMVVVHNSFLIYGAVDPADPPSWKQLAWAGDTLLIAAGTHGVGVLDLAALGHPDSQSAGRGGAFERACAGRLVYVPAGGDVVRVQPVGTGQALAVVRSADGDDTVRVRLPGG